jgi:hypothetical protein
VRRLESRIYLTNTSIAGKAAPKHKEETETQSSELEQTHKSLKLQQSPEFGYISPKCLSKI